MDGERRKVMNSLFLFLLFDFIILLATAFSVVMSRFRVYPLIVVIIFNDILL